MKKATISLFLVAFALTSSLAFADADDVKWVEQCVKDNNREGATPDVVKKYCECMNGKMSNEETKSITQWEKSHPKEMKECDAESGWK